MEPDDLLCSRNARPEKYMKGSLVVLLLAERAPFQERETSKLGGII